MNGKKYYIDLLKKTYRLVKMYNELEENFPTILSKDVILDQLNEIISLTEDRPSSEKTKYHDVNTGFISYKMTGIFEYAFYHLIDDLKVLCDFNKEEGLKARGEISSIVEKLDSDDDYFVQALIGAVEALIRH